MGQNKMTETQLVVLVGETITKQIMHFNRLAELSEKDALYMARKLQFENDIIFCWMIESEMIYKFFNEPMQKIALLLRGGTNGTYH